MCFLLGSMEKLPNGCGLRRFAKPRGNILLAFPYQLCIVVLPITRNKMSSFLFCIAQNPFVIIS